MAKYYTEVPFPSVYFSIVMNKRKWKSLPKDVQDAIMSVSGVEGSRYWGRHFFDKMKASGVAKIKAAGHSENLFTLTPSEREQWLNRGGKPVWEKWVKKMEAKGHANARDILNSAISLSEP